MYKLVIETDSLDELFATVSALRDKAVVTLSGACHFTGEEEIPVKKTRSRKSGPLVTKVDVAGEETPPGEPGELPQDRIDSIKPLGDVIAEKIKKTVKASDAPIPYAEVGKATLALRDKKGVPATLAILENFGVSSARNLPVDKFAEYLTLVESAME
jgi:hypothetical protein